MQAPFAPLRSGEKRLLVAVIVAASLVGGCAGYGAYLGEAEAQFHGGVLEEDRAAADWALVREPAWAFVRWTVGIGFVFGVLPVGVWRLFRRREC
jgi:hypothetical protein